MIAILKTLSLLQELDNEIFKHIDLSQKPALVV